MNTMRYKGSMTALISNTLVVALIVSVPVLVQYASVI